MHAATARRPSPPALTLAACHAEGTAPPPPAAAAEAPARSRSRRSASPPPAMTRAYTGVVRARREADVGFRAAGRIVERLSDVGAPVAAGAARWPGSTPPTSPSPRRAAEAELASAEAQSRQAAAEAARSRVLLAAGHVAQAYDDGRQATARSAAERAAAARAQLELARNRLDYAVLRAPTDGVVTALLAEAGQVVAEGQPVLRLAKPEERELVVQVPEAAVAALERAQRPPPASGPGPARPCPSGCASWRRRPRRRSAPTPPASPCPGRPTGSRSA